MKYLLLVVIISTCLSLNQVTARPQSDMSVQDRAQEIFESLKERAQEALDLAQDAANRFLDNAKQYVQNHVQAYSELVQQGIQSGQNLAQLGENTAIKYLNNSLLATTSEPETPQ